MFWHGRVRAHDAPRPQMKPSRPAATGARASSWLEEEAPLGRSLRTLGGRLLRRGRASWFLWAPLALVAGAVMARSSAHHVVYSAEVVLWATAGRPETTDDSDAGMGRLRGYIREWAFTGDHLLELMGRYKREFPGASARPSEAIESMRKATEVKVASSDFIEDRAADDPPPSARITVTYTASTPESALTMARELASLVVSSALHRENEMAEHAEAATATALKQLAGDVTPGGARGGRQSPDRPGSGKSAGGGGRLDRRPAGQSGRRRERDASVQRGRLGPAAAAAIEGAVCGRDDRHVLGCAPRLLVAGGRVRSSDPRSDRPDRYRAHRSWSGPAAAGLASRQTWREGLAIPDAYIMMSYSWPLPFSPRDQLNAFVACGRRGSAVERRSVSSPWCWACSEPRRSPSRPTGSIDPKPSSPTKGRADARHRRRDLGAGPLDARERSDDLP